MRATVDTNVLVRAVVGDDRRQARAAANALKDASLIAVTLPCLCEFVWVLRRVYRFGADDIAVAVETLLRAGNVAADRPAVEAGLEALRSGGDFADGVIAYEGRWLGGDTFISFDRAAVTLLRQHGHASELVS